ncbi:MULTISPECIES: hypothetical protein [unclassified Acinetobacter]|uniref:hypothetical protein n=1 Tax=unclassified Acinetobacter TaxID=196816 RepID=UPI0029349DA9|nr:MULTISPECIES: hypothetical protein [unclassified Acinetobacter]WOE30329.1 hypothetical protein QSG84_07805 [Acinetobacter sp. SAAs470]WOE38520.1 hypothetical protein QSG86_01470 [Acinetobacter sp. SAAs474]
MANLPPPESTPWGWKALIISCIVGAIFLAFIYLAVNTEADYMPSQQHKQNMQQHAFKEAPTMSPEALQKAQQDQLKREEIEKNMNNHAMAKQDHMQMNMPAQEASSTHSH